MKTKVITSLVIALCLEASMASAQSIGVFFASDGSDCDTVQPEFAPGTAYVLALLGGGSAGGMTGAEFRVDGVPAAWFPSATPNPASNITLGNPLTGGCNIAFPTCQTGTGGVLLLYTINYFATSNVVDLYYTVNKKIPPSNFNFQCPLHVLCFAQNYALVCARGGQARVNGGPCTISVEPMNWSQVKNLYN